MPLQSRKRSKVPFNNRHEIQYGLKVISRATTRRVYGVICRFCEAFGTEIVEGRVAKTNREKSTPLIFSKSFRTDNCRLHLVEQHNKKWVAYEKLISQEKLSFFNQDVSFVETIDAHFSASNSALYSFDSTIVKLILRFLVKHDENGLANSVIQDMVEHEDGIFRLKVSSTMKFDICTRFVSQGKSFRQTLESIQTARETGFSPRLAGVTEGSIRKSVQSTIAINLQRVRDVLTDKSTWAYSTVLDVATDREESYLDVGLCVHIDSGIETVTS